MSAAGYGTLLQEEERTPLVVDKLRSEVKTARATVLVGLVLAVLFCSTTFAVVCVAVAHSSELQVHQAVLVSKLDGQPVQTRKHEETIDDVFAPYAGERVRWITISHKDGSFVRTAVSAFEKRECVDTLEQTCVEGFHYYFHTVLGVYCGTVAMNDAFEPVTTFVPVADADYQQVKSAGEAMKRALLDAPAGQVPPLPEIASYASGDAHAQLQHRMAKTFDQDGDGDFDTEDLFHLSHKWGESIEETLEEIQDFNAEVDAKVHHSGAESPAVQHAKEELKEGQRRVKAKGHGKVAHGHNGKRGRLDQI